MIEPLAIPSDADVLTVLPRLRAALAGGAPIRPYAAGSPPPQPAAPASLPDGLAVAIGTSGSTGNPKLAMLTTPALTASADATHERLGGPGHWLLALPAHHIAGLQVLLRSIRTGTIPIVQDTSAGFTAAGFRAAAARLERGARQYTSLVPAQLQRILEDPAATTAAARLDAILLGGQAIDPALRAAAQHAGITVVTTYGMSETGGGCVYDGLPLRGVRVAIDTHDGRISLGGPVVAAGYLGDPDRTRAVFHGSGSERWFRTDDHGHLDAQGRVRVDGRLDELINSGGLKVAPRLVEEALRAHVPGVRDACVVGLPDPHWGQVVAAALVCGPPAPQADDSGLAEPAEPREAPVRLAPGPGPSLPQVRELLRGILPDHALPRRVVTLPALPLRGPGKPDRRAIRDILRMGE